MVFHRLLWCCFFQAAVCRTTAQKAIFPDNAEWPIRVNAEHILSDPENRERLPKKLLRFKNLPLLLETAVELGRRKAVIEPGLVVPQGYQNQLQFLLPICLTDMEKPNLAMTLAERNGYYLGSTCLTLEMAYLNARMIARPIAPWLTSLVKKWEHPMRGRIFSAPCRCFVILERIHFVKLLWIFFKLVTTWPVWVVE